IPYMSPEQIRGLPVDGRTDVWALGILLYESLAGLRPFDGPTQGMILESVLTGTPAPLRQKNPGVPEALERIINKCLQKDRSLRYQRASELLPDLRKGALPSNTRRSATFGIRWATIAVSAAAVTALVTGSYSYLHK